MLLITTIDSIRQQKKPRRRIQRRGLRVLNPSIPELRSPLRPDFPVRNRANVTTTSGSENYEPGR